MRFLASLAATVLLVGLSAAQTPAPTYQQATILDIQSKTAHSAVHKATDAPAPTDQASYDITIQIGDTVYVGLYQHASDFVPSNWQVGKPVDARVGPRKHRIYLKDVSGKEVALPIITRKAAKSAPASK
jgi:hypothetical protein